MSAPSKPAEEMTMGDALDLLGIGPDTMVRVEGNTITVLGDGDAGDGE